MTSDGHFEPKPHEYHKYLEIDADGLVVDKIWRNPHSPPQTTPVGEYEYLYWNDPVERVLMVDDDGQPAWPQLKIVLLAMGIIVGTMYGMDLIANLFGLEREPTRYRRLYPKEDLWGPQGPPIPQRVMSTENPHNFTHGHYGRAQSDDERRMLKETREKSNVTFPAPPIY